MQKKWIGFLSCLLPGLYLANLRTNRSDNRKRMQVFKERYIAHRGLFDNEKDYPENTMAAFRRAVERGYGIELDLQTSRDGKVVVFHDPDLQRMCGDPRKIADCSYRELQRLTVGKSKERIPTFKEVLSLVDGRVPLVVEIKGEGFWKATSRGAAHLLDSYGGAYCIESFHPGAVRWFYQNRPGVLRGLLATNFMKEPSDLNLLFRFLAANLQSCRFIRPDFISIDLRYRKSLPLFLTRHMNRVTLMGWTVKSQAQLEEVRSDLDICIFDSFEPEGGPCVPGV